MVNNREGTVSINGAELYYSTQGSGPTCLVLSAIGSEPYKRLTPPQLADRLRLVYVDLRGGGRSTGNPADLTFEVLAGDLEAIRAESSSLRVPIFIAQGRHDYTVPYVLWDGVVDALPNATLRLFEKSGHQPFFEEPAVFADALSKWMVDQG